MEKSCIFMLTFLAALAMGYYFGVSYNRNSNSACNIEIPDNSTSTDGELNTPQKAHHFVISVENNTLSMYINGTLQICVEDLDSCCLTKCPTKDSWFISFYYPKVPYGSNTSKDKK